MTASSAVPATFRRAVCSLAGVQPRPEVELTEVPPPRRLAPWSYALSAEVGIGEQAGTGDQAAGTGGQEAAVVTARLVLLHDPEGQDAWTGVLRLVLFLRAELDGELAGDPMLPAVGWSWLTEGLEVAGARWRALGGTVTQSSSARFGDIAGPARADDLELRASWTPIGEDLGPHGEAFCAVVAAAAGLPPIGVAGMSRRHGG